MQKIKWGVIGTGWLSGMFTENLKAVSDAELYAVCSENYEHAQSFAETHGFSKVCHSLDELLGDSSVDCVLIGTRNDRHAPIVKKCIMAGVASVCAKPLTCTLKETEEIFKLSQKHNVLALEEMWLVYRPDVRAIREFVKGGELGDVIRFEARCCYHHPNGYSPDMRLCNKAEGGGSTLSMAVYSAALAQFILGVEPIEVKAVGNLCPGGTDLGTEIIMRYDNAPPNATLAYLATTMFGDNSQELYISGTKGTLRMRDFWHTDRFTVENTDGEISEHVFPEAAGSQSENHERIIMAVNAYLRDSQNNPLDFPLADSVKTARLMQQALEQVGVRY